MSFLEKKSTFATPHPPIFHNCRTELLKTMLTMNRVLIRSVKSVSALRASRVAWFSESHDDFKPVKKEKAVIESGLDDVVKLVTKQVSENSVMLYMKGTPQQPQCGFSMQAVRVLNAAGVEFSAVNVLEYPAVREAVKVYSEWPTIPQLYVAGEFVGGADIMTSMYQDGSLAKLFKDHKLLKE